MLVCQSYPINTRPGRRYWWNAAHSPHVLHFIQTLTAFSCNPPRPRPRSIFKASLPPSLRIRNIQQAFVDGSWIPEARYPNSNLGKILHPTSWGFCGKGSAHGKCKDRYVCCVLRVSVCPCIRVSVYPCIRVCSLRGVCALCIALLSC